MLAHSATPVTSQFGRAVELLLNGKLPTTLVQNLTVPFGLLDLARRRNRGSPAGIYTYT